MMILPCLYIYSQSYYFTKESNDFYGDAISSTILNATSDTHERPLGSFVRHNNILSTASREIEGAQDGETKKRLNRKNSAECQKRDESEKRKEVSPNRKIQMVILIWLYKYVVPSFICPSHLKYQTSIATSFEFRKRSQKILQTTIITRVTLLLKNKKVTTKISHHCQTKNLLTKT